MVPPQMTSHQQGDDNTIILPLPQHLPLERHLPMPLDSQKNPHHLVRDAYVSIKQFSESDVGLPVRIWVVHSLDHIAHVGYLIMDVLLGSPGTFGCLFWCPPWGVRNPPRLLWRRRDMEYS